MTIQFVSIIRTKLTCKQLLKAISLSLRQCIWHIAVPTIKTSISKERHLLPSYYDIISYSALSARITVYTILIFQLIHAIVDSEVHRILCFLYLLIFVSFEIGSHKDNPNDRATMCKGLRPHRRFLSTT